jgi:hypothetical protein
MDKFQDHLDQWMLLFALPTHMTPREERDIEEIVATLKALPGYPWVPCPICNMDEGCCHPFPVRARAAIPGLVLPRRT